MTESTLIHISKLFRTHTTKSKLRKTDHWDGLLVRPNRELHESFYDWGIRIALMNQIEPDRFIRNITSSFINLKIPKILKFFKGLEKLTRENIEIRSYDLECRSDIFDFGKLKCCEKCYLVAPYFRFFWRLTDYTTCHIHQKKLSNVSGVPSISRFRKMKVDPRIDKFSYSMMRKNSTQFLMDRISLAERDPNLHTSLLYEAEIRLALSAALLEYRGFDHMKSTLSGGWIYDCATKDDFWLFPLAYTIRDLHVDLREPGKRGYGIYWRCVRYCRGYKGHRWCTSSKAIREVVESCPCKNWDHIFYSYFLVKCYQ